jgi:hypothetical protein
MAPTPLRIAHTSTELKKQYKKNGPQFAERQQKQLERGHELDVRAARLRDAEERRRAAKKKRDEMEDKQKAARMQTGVGLATQLIGYNHTQAKLKSGMEAFLGLKRRKEEEQRKRETELAKKLEQIAQVVEKEPWDDDDADDLALDLPQMNVLFGELYADDELDDDTLLEAHDLSVAPQPAPAKDDADFTRLHGPINRAVESILDKLPEPLVELLSQDMSMKLPDWAPAHGLLHKLNPLGLPPHRLRIKIGSVVSLLRDVKPNSQLSKSQHLRVVRVENERLECLVLDGQLEGTKTFLTRIPFPAKYRNDEAYPFQRTQFPIRVATDYTPPSAPRQTPPTGCMLPISNQVRPSSLPKRADPTPCVETQPNKKPGFKVPGLPASKSAPATLIPSVPSTHITVPQKAFVLDGWDDFLESGTQIARELSSDVVSAPQRPPSNVKFSPSIAQSLPPLSTQDFDFSMDDLEDVEEPVRIKPSAANTTPTLPIPKPLLPSVVPSTEIPLPTGAPASIQTLTAPQQSVKERQPKMPPNRLPPKRIRASAPPLDLSTITPSQMPRSVPDHHPKMFKRKIYAVPKAQSLPPAKRPRGSVAASKPAAKRDNFDDFGLSTQQAASFFDDDEDMFGASPPIAV